jgi:hypothetical protein
LPLFHSLHPLLHSLLSLLNLVKSLFHPLLPFSDGANFLAQFRDFCPQGIYRFPDGTEFTGESFLEGSLTLRNQLQIGQEDDDFGDEQPSELLQQRRVFPQRVQDCLNESLAVFG